MGIDFNSFLNTMKNIASMNGQAGIQQGVEADLAKAKFIEFKKDMAMTAPIDTFERKDNGVVDNSNKVDNVSVEDLMALLDAPELDLDKVNQYINEKPVSVETKEAMAKVGEVKQPEVVKSMVILSDGDTDAINFYNNLAYANGSDKSIENTTSAAEEAMDTLGSNKLYDALMYVPNLG